MKISFLIAGIILLIVAVSGYILTQNIISDCQSLLNNLEGNLAPDIEQKCKLTKAMQFGFMFIGAGGVGALIYGVILKAKPKKDLPEIPKLGSNQKALDILKDKLVKGEISQETFDELKKAFE
ncbi:MAG: hypothetical protein ACREAG_06435 [Nitrosopumilaceae archaeon]